MAEIVKSWLFLRRASFEMEMLRQEILQNGLSLNPHLWADECVRTGQEGPLKFRVREFDENVEGLTKINVLKSEVRLAR